MMLLFWGVVVALVVFVVRSVGHRPESSPNDGGTGQTQALKILDERLARGEIDVEEYNQRRDVLRR